MTQRLLIPTLGLLLLLPTALAQAETETEQLSRTMRENPRRETVLPLLPKVSLLLRNEETALETLPVVEQAAAILRPTAAENGTVTATASLLKVAARMRFEQAEPNVAAQHLQSLRELYRALGERLPRENAEWQRARWSHEVALEYLRSAQTKSALEVIGDRVDRGAKMPPDFDETQAAVAGALHRRLEQLSTNERYDLLYAWSMPTEGRRTVRVLSSLASCEAPPDVFARALGERPRANAFSIPAVGGVNGLFSTAWVLVRAAAESGRLRRLTPELEELAKAKVPNADFVLLVARIVDEAFSAEELQGVIGKRLESLTPVAPVQKPGDAGVPPAGLVASDELHWFVLGAACMERQPLRGTSQRVFETLVERITDGSSPYARPFLRRARAIAILKQHDGSDPNTLADPGLKFWIPASEENAARSATGAVREIWLMHEDHILHLAGPHNDYLCFRYPLTGEFEFQVEAQNGGKEHTFGNLAFGGLAYGVAGNADEFRVWGLDMGQMLTRPFPFVRKEQWATYQRLALRSSDKGIVHLVNGHPVWTDPLRDSTSPWLALRCFGDYIPAFRNFRLTGNPVIPREVHMSDGNLLRGWFTQFYPSKVSSAVPLIDGAAANHPITPAKQSGQSPSPPGLTQNDWFIRDGVIHGAQRGEQFRTAVPSRLTYFRPLQNDESIRYEFLYEPGKQEVHPALGRLAFLIEPNGVRVHWMSSGETDWTGLAENNAAIEPLNRRGPRPSPLKAGEWNRVTMVLNKDTLSLTLNDIEIYSRKMETENSRRFSFYHDRNRSAVQVRNVVLRGNWPEKLTEEELKNLLAPRENKQGPIGAADPSTLGATCSERQLTDTALAIHRKAVAMAPAERLELLANYVLPGTNHDSLRLSLEFTANNAPPSVADHDAIDEIRASNARKELVRSRIQLGGNLVSPALDLIAVARQLGRLEEVRRRVSSAPQATNLEQRQRLAMLAMVDIARDDYASANDLLHPLFGLVEQGTHTEFAQRWPETLAAFAALHLPATRSAGRELAVHLHLRQARSGADSGSEAWRRHIASWVGLSRYFDESVEPSIAKFTTAPRLKQWDVVVSQTAQSRGFGFPRSHWEWNATGVESLSRHAADYLYFQSPLRGNYEVECDVPAFGWRETQVMVGGEWLWARPNLKSYSHGNFRRSLSLREVSPPFVKPEEDWHYRVVVRNGVVTHFVNGRLVQERRLEQHADPWVAIRSDTPGHGAAKNVWITGRPEIPDVIQLESTKELGGWIAYFDTHGVGSGPANWRLDSDLVNGGGIVGRYQPELAGSFAESLFRYHRPMLEDGTIEYEFYYRDGESHCHPALDRLAFLLEPAGIRIHWVTDGNYDRTELVPDNVVDEPEKRRGPDRLPLRANAWNRLAGTMRGDVVQLSLNGQLIYERELEPTNQRTFGLFHYADQTEARVRNITWRGNWPRQLPAIADQELLGDESTFLDGSLPPLPARFDHDFTKDGFPSDRFSILYSEGETFAPLPDGLHVDHPGGQGHRNAIFAPRLSLQGDFDITATYEQLDTKPTPDGNTSLYLTATLNDDQRTECMMLRRHVLSKHGADLKFHQASVVRQKDQSELRPPSRLIASESMSGRLRLARRGTTVYFLFADGDSPVFRLAKVEKLSPDHIEENNVRINNQTRGPGRVGIVWTSLSIRAEKLSGTATEDRSKIVAQLDRERAALPIRFAHNFARDQFTAERFHHWGFEPVNQPSDAGLIVSGPPSDNWANAGAEPQVALGGDFDASFDFELLQMTAPKTGMSSEVFLQLEAPDGRQYHVTLVGVPDGSKYVSAQLRERSPEGAFRHPSIGREYVDRVQRLRLARRGNQLYFLFSSDTSQPDRLLGRHDISPLDIPATLIRVLIHTGGTGKITETAWKNFSIHAK